MTPAADADEPPRVRAAALLVIAAASLALDHRESAVEAFTQSHALIEHERIYTSYECIPRRDLETLATLAAVSLPDLPWIAAPRHTPEHVPLSRREQEVLRYLASDMPMSEIAAALFVSPNTLKSTARRLYRKLGVDSRGAAVDAGRNTGLL